MIGSGRWGIKSRRKPLSRLTNSYLHCPDWSYSRCWRSCCCRSWRTGLPPLTSLKRQSVSPTRLDSWRKDPLETQTVLAPPLHLSLESPLFSECLMASSCCCLSPPAVSCLQTKYTRNNVTLSSLFLCFLQLPDNHTNFHAHFFLLSFVESLVSLEHGE